MTLEWTLLYAYAAIAVLLLLVLVAAAKRRRRSRPLVPIKFSTEVGLGTLATDTGLTTVSTGALEHDFNIVSTDLTVNMRDHTAGEGPIEFGLAMVDYTAAEIVEALDASPLGPYGPEMERSRRKVRHYASFDGSAAFAEVNDGKPIRRKMFLRVPAGKSAADVWFINRDPAALTTGTVMEITGVHWGRWQ